MGPELSTEGIVLWVRQVLALGSTLVKGRGSTAEPGVRGRPEAYRSPAFIRQTDFLTQALFRTFEMEECCWLFSLFTLLALWGPK